MPKPKSKSELILACKDGFQRLNDSLETLTPAQLKSNFTFDHRDKNIRDTLAHLHEWQRMMLEWYSAGMSNEMPEMPAKGYTWRMTPELNFAIWSKYQRVSLKRIRSDLLVSHGELIGIMEKHTNAELFTKRRYSWTGSTSLGSYLTSATSSHYDWAIKLIRRYIRDLGNCRDS